MRCRMDIIIDLALGIRKIIFSLLLLFTFSASAQAQDNPVLSGKYKSLNGELEHHFADNGDYTGIGRFEKATKTYQGVYRFSSGLCWSPGPNGSKGATGNVVLYFEETQCCLLFEDISDKIAVTYVWSKPHNFPFGICSSQVLKKQ